MFDEHILGVLIARLGKREIFFFLFLRERFGVSVLKGTRKKEKPSEDGIENFQHSNHLTAIV